MIDYKLHSKSGFTFIELVIAIIVIFILSAIAIPVVTNIFGASNSSSDEASAKYMETELTNIYNVAFSGEKKGHHYVFNWEKIDKTQIKDLFTKILINGTGNADDTGDNASGYGSVKLSNGNNTNNTYNFVNGKNCFLGKNDLPFLCIKDAQGIDCCRIFYCVSIDKNESVLKCKDTEGNLYVIYSPSGDFFSATRVDDGSAIDLTFINGNDVLRTYFGSHDMLNGSNDNTSSSEN